VRGGLEDGGWQLQAANNRSKILLIIITTIGQVKRKWATKKVC
jgi:hypothetical protein